MKLADTYSTYCMRLNGRGKRYPVTGIADAVAQWTQYRTETGVPSSEVGCVMVEKDGVRVARISYNGRVWHPVTGEEMKTA